MRGDEGRDEGRKRRRRGNMGVYFMVQGRFKVRGNKEGK